jgi:rhodanese-related sulfurtransferase
LAVSWRDLLRPEFIGSPAGSSIEQVQRAAHFAGLHSHAVQRLVVHDLRSSDPQFILHVRSHPGLPDPDHFILLLEAGATLRVYDPLHGERRLSRAELSAIWRGVAILVSSRPISPVEGSRGSLMHLVAWLGAGSLLAFGLSHWTRRTRGAALPWATTVAVACILGIAWQYARLGLVPGRLRFLDEHVTDAFLTKASVEDVRSGKFVLLDVRLPERTEQKTIPGALNLDGSRLEAERSGVLRGTSVNPTTPLILFCDDEKCTNAHRAAQVLISDGFRDVRVFPAGLRGWFEGADGAKREP